MALASSSASCTAWLAHALPSVGIRILRYIRHLPRRPRGAPFVRRARVRHPRGGGRRSASRGGLHLSIGGRAHGRPTRAGLRPCRTSPDADRPRRWGPLGSIGSPVRDGRSIPVTATTPGSPLAVTGLLLGANDRRDTCRRSRQGALLRWRTPRRALRPAPSPNRHALEGRHAHPAPDRLQPHGRARPRAGPGPRRPSAREAAPRPRPGAFPERRRPGATCPPRPNRSTPSCSGGSPRTARTSRGSCASGSRTSAGDATSELVWGNVLPELLRLANEHDLVVMGAHGANPFDEAFLGGVAGRLVRRTTTPVLTVREGCDRTHVARLLVATDFAEASLAAWTYATHLAQVAKREAGARPRRRREAGRRARARRATRGPLGGARRTLRGAGGPPGGQAAGARRRTRRRRDRRRHAPPRRDRRPADGRPRRRPHPLEPRSPS